MYNYKIYKIYKIVIEETETAEVTEIVPENLYEVDIVLSLNLVFFKIPLNFIFIFGKNIKKKDFFFFFFFFV